MFKSLMHASFFAENLDEMTDFYVNKLGAKIKMLIRNRAYADKPNHSFYKRALENPDGICIVYFEIAPGQFIEFFPKEEKQEPHRGWNQDVGYSHIGILVEDLFETKRELEERGLKFLTEPTIGNSHTWQMWLEDPEGNRIEFMQYTEESFQIVGHIDATQSA